MAALILSQIDEFEKQIRALIANKDAFPKKWYPPANTTIMPMVIPILLELFDDEGYEVSYDMRGEQEYLEIDKIRVRRVGFDRHTIGDVEE